MSSLNEELEQIVADAVVAAAPQPQRRRLIVGVSGGVDSVVLLHALNSIADSLALSLVVAHLNHKFREQSDSDAQFVSSLAERYRLKFVLETAPPRPERENLEAWGREQRYNFFDRTLVTEQAHLIVTAHHRDDLVETLLWRVVSGRLATDAHTLAERDLSRNLVRPLFRVSREEIVRYQQRNELRYVEDDSNYDQDRTRNRIRHSLIPELRREYNPNLIDSLAEVSARLGNDEELLWSVAREMLEGEPESDLFHLPLALQWRVLKLRCVEQVGEVGERLGYRAFQRVLRDLEDGQISERDLGFGVRVELERTTGASPFSLSRFRFSCAES